ncbi:uncharacterized protein TNCV_2288481 [Trichonephila clavipes]|nr:uncharacterized protein TNCV_2288481 [Trichonephila clavipes]
MLHLGLQIVPANLCVLYSFTLEQLFDTHCTKRSSVVFDEKELSSPISLEEVKISVGTKHETFKNENCTIYKNVSFSDVVGVTNLSSAKSISIHKEYWAPLLICPVLALTVPRKTSSLIIKHLRIIGRLECGRTQLEVSKELGIALSVISRLWQRFQDDGNVSRCYSTGHPQVTAPNEDRYLQLLPKEIEGAQHPTSLVSCLQLPVRQFQGRPCTDA